MAKIQLIIDADDGYDLLKALKDLLDGKHVEQPTPYFMHPALDDEDPQVEATEAAAGEPKQRKPRRTQAQMAAAAADAALAAAGGQPSSASATDAPSGTQVQTGSIQSASSQPSGASAKPADVFGDQIKEVAAEAKAEGAPTLDMIKTALTACMSAKGALAAQTILKEHANGVGRISEIDPAHYAAVYAALTA